MGMSLRGQVRLFILVVLAFIPAVALYVFTGNNLRTQHITSRENELIQFARVTAVEYDRLLDESASLLAALSEFPEIRSAEPDACNTRLAAVLDHMPRYTTLSMIGPDGYLTCGSLTVDGSLYLGDRAYFRLATARRRFSVGNYAVGRITSRPTIGVGYPIMTPSGSDIQAVLAAAIDLSVLSSEAERTHIPHRANLTLIDRNGTVLVRVPQGLHPLGYDTVGATARPSFPELTAGIVEPYVLLGIDLDEVDRRFAVVPLRGSGQEAAAHLLVGLEEYVLQEEATEAVSVELRFLAAAGFLLLLLTWFYGHYGLLRDAATKHERE